MTNEEQALFEIRCAIAKLPPEYQVEIKIAADKIRDVCRSSPFAPMALAFVGAEFAATIPEEFSDGRPSSKT